MFPRVSSLSRCLLRNPLISSANIQKRTFWEYVNMMFNKPDPDRIKKLGPDRGELEVLPKKLSTSNSTSHKGKLSPDRACAEWVLRNGGSIVWSDGKKLADYNYLPSEDVPVPKLIEIDGTESGISHYGFEHLNGCTELKKITLHNNGYIDDRAMEGLNNVKETLQHLQVSKCDNVTDKGIKQIQILDKLQNLKLFDLKSVNELENCKQFLKSKLPKCTIHKK